MPTKMLPFLLLGSLLLAASARADEFLRGYASALLEKSAPDLALSVEDSAERGRVILQGARCLEPAEQTRVETALLAAPQIRSIEWRLPCEQPVAAATPAAEEAPTELTPLPEYQLFDWLLADPREAGFSATWQYQKAANQEFNAGDVAFGSYFGFAEGDSRQGRWQFGLQGAVFALFNLDAESTDLVNADYWIGLPFTFRHGRWSYRARLYHQSSHLGDEFLLGNQDIDRINLSYEVIDGLASYDWHSLRAYAGGGVIVRAEPDLDRWLLHYGIELRRPDFVGPFALLAGVDFKQSQEQDWELNHSTRIGLGYRRGSRNIALLLEHYDGFSPNGQFFNVPIEYFGIGMYFGM